jgi:hypothetical protein
MMCMERFSTMTLRGCYKATVNESETITEAKPLCRVRNRGEPGERLAPGFRFPVAPQIERS